METESGTESGASKMHKDASCSWAPEYAKCKCTELQALSAESQFTLSSHQHCEVLSSFPFYRQWNFGFEKLGHLPEATELGSINIEPTSVWLQCSFSIFIQYRLLLRVKEIAEEISRAEGKNQ